VWVGLVRVTVIDVGTSHDEQKNRPIEVRRGSEDPKKGGRLRKASVGPSVPTTS